MTTPLRKRAKPLLGTIVEIAIPFADEVTFQRITNIAFRRIEQIHRAMSFHEAESDLRKLANARAGDVVTVSQDTWNTLQLALEIEAVSDAIFNVTIAPTLVQRGQLPCPNAENPAPTTLANCIALDNNSRVRIIERAWIDLGGIAKGYAVDAAVEALQTEVACGLVNAGGDLRVFGELNHLVSVRMPSTPDRVMLIAELTNRSVATSAKYYSAADNIVGNRDAGTCESVSVIASTCAVADALTKILWLKNPGSMVVQKVLSHFQANAALIDDCGQVTRI